MYVIGTAGHVDHGKSTLIEAITGTHPDRLAEEQERELSIVLGFDSMSLKSGQEVGIVDVPGHRDFIENMLSGIGGIDAVLFVVAADEGVMPQTEEHLAIIDLLGIDDGVVALTKIDMVEDREWLDLVEVDLQETLQGTTLAEAPIVRVSGKTGTGVDLLINTLENALSSRSPRPDLGRPRLSIDRAFTISGFGTVVTGTLLDGTLQVGEEVVILPHKLKGRIRGLQVHNRDVSSAAPGTRTAINISGVNTEDIDRGDLVAHPGDYRPTRRLDVFFQHLTGVLKPVTHNSRAKLFLGADEVMARIRLLGKDSLSSGEEGFLQLEVPEAVVALRGDRYILRRPSPSETIGGGIILDPHPLYRHKRFDGDLLSRLKALHGGKPEQILQQILQRSGVLSKTALITRSSLEPEGAEKTLAKLVEEGVAIPVGKKGGEDQLLAYQPDWERVLQSLLEAVEEYHRQYPLRPGIPGEELKSQSELEEASFQAAVTSLIKSERLVQKGPLLARPAHEISFSPEQQALVKSLMDQFAAKPFMPPTVEECVAMVGEEVYNALVTQEALVPVSPEIVFRKGTYKQMVEEVKHWLEQKETITVAEARDHFDSSRRYMLAFLEHLDSRGITIREGDVRRLR